MGGGGGRVRKREGVSFEVKYILQSASFFLVFQPGFTFFLSCFSSVVLCFAVFCCVLLYFNEFLLK